jgi:hypothetical protein
MITFRSIFIITFGSAVLASCAGTGSNAVFIPPDGTLAELNREVTVPRGGRVFIQYGQVVERGRVNVISPYCHFTVDRPGQDSFQPSTLDPDTFTITRTHQGRSYALSEDVQFAGRAGVDHTLSTVMELTSDQQPEVKRLTCSRWGMISDDGWLTIAEMTSTLSGLVDIVLSE